VIELLAVEACEAAAKSIAAPRPAAIFALMAMTITYLPVHERSLRLGLVHAYRLPGQAVNVLYRPVRRLVEPVTGASTLPTGIKPGNV
jgi:hypothetical protein